MTESDVRAELDRSVAVIQRAKANAKWIAQSSDHTKDGKVRSILKAAQLLADWSETQIERD